MYKRALKESKVKEIKEEVDKEKMWNSDTSPSPVKKKKREDKSEKRQPENQTASPSKFVKTEK